jgi:hypothetical protein
MQLGRADHSVPPIMRREKLKKAAAPPRAIQAPLAVSSASVYISY